MLALVGTLLMLDSISTSKNIAPSWNFRIENITSFAMSNKGEYLIVACEKGPLCEKGQFYVFDRYGNTEKSGCTENEITAVDIADNGAFFIGTRNGYYFSSSSGKIQEEFDMGNVVESASLSENGEIVVAGASREILILGENGIIDRKDVERPVNSTAIDPSGKIAVAQTGDKIYLYERTANNWIEKVIPTGGIADLAISDDRSTIICGMSTRIIWILDSKLNLKKSTMVGGTIECVATTANGRFFVCGTSGGKVFYLNSSGDELWSSDVDEKVDDVYISSDGELVAALSRNITLFDSEGDDIQEIGSSRAVKSLQLSKSGEILSYISDDELAFISLYERSHIPTGEYMIPSRKGIPLDDQLKEVWSYGKNPQAAVVADINGDGKNEIVCTFDKEIAVLNLKGKELWKKSFQFQPGVAVFDVTGDFVPEVIVKSKDNRMGVYVFDGKGEERAYHEFYLKWYSEPPSEELTIGIHPIMSSDIDDDGFIEVVCIVSAGYLLNPRGLFVFEYPSFDEEWYYRVAPDLSTIYVADINGDGKAEVVAGSHAPCNGRLIRNTDDCHTYIYAVTLEGNELWSKRIGSRGFKRTDLECRPRRGMEHNFLWLW